MNKEYDQEILTAESQKEQNGASSAFGNLQLAAVITAVIHAYADEPVIIKTIRRAAMQDHWAYDTQPNGCCDH